jgi:hypothetical protein
MNTEIQLASDCQIVNGFIRTCIYDLTREEFYLYKRINDISEISNDFLEFLIENEVVNQISTQLNFQFPKIDFTFIPFSKVSNITFELNSFNIKNFLKFSILNCSTYGLIIKDLNYNLLYLKFSEVLNESINNLSLFIIDSKLIIEDIDLLNEMYLKYSFLEITVYTDNHVIFNYLTTLKKNHVIVKSTNEFNQTEISITNFSCNILTFSESQNHNLYLNGKLYVDADGYIKNSINSNIPYANIDEIHDDENLNLLLEREENKIWFISKDKIDVCKHCEFRYMCVDNRIPIKRNEVEWFYATECNYNPFIAKWVGENGYKSLTECGIKSDSGGFIIESQKINKINNELWNDD